MLVILGVAMELRKAEVSLLCESCGRPLRVTLQDVREGRSVRCLAGHRMDLGISEGLPLPEKVGRR